MFFWKFHCNTVGEETFGFDRFSFNPCFSGSSTATPLAKRHSGLIDSVSILVFLEVPLQPISLNFVSLSRSQFQSLFFWKFHCNQFSKLIEDYTKPRFNPCFSGSSTATFSIMLISSLPQRAISFNPCFSGSSTATVSSVSDDGFFCHVSILVFLEVPLQPLRKAREALITTMFQSLFFWKFHCNVVDNPK